MKYLGENSLKTLISLIKGEIILKQDKITAEGVLQRTSDDKIEAVTIDKDYVGLGKVGNFKSVSTEANQSLRDIEKKNALANIGAAKKEHNHAMISIGNYTYDGTQNITIPIYDGETKI